MPAPAPAHNASVIPPLLLGVLAAATVAAQQPTSLAAAPTAARAADGRFIAWREHLIDGETVNGVPLRGSDGLVLGDLDRDGFVDVVSVHESDEQYDGVPEGHIRVAFGGRDPDVWESVTLAEGPDAGAAEDVALADVNGDGWLDVVAACELAHLIYLENPGAAARTREWRRLIPSSTRERGSFIRVFLADLNGDGRPEVITANKGAQDPTRAAQEPRAISFFHIDGAPLDDSAWHEQVLTLVPWPINAQPADLDADGDTDIVAGTVAEGRILWFENVGAGGRFDFREHAVTIAAANGGAVPRVNGFNMAFDDVNGDGRRDIVTFDTTRLTGLSPVWLEHPSAVDEPWVLHRIGTYAPDQLVGFALADIDGDGLLDLMTGGYSLGSRAADGTAAIGAALGRLAWFEKLDETGLTWQRHDFSRRERGMYDAFVARDMDGDGDTDFVTTRGNSGVYDGVLWLEQSRSSEAQPAFTRARAEDSPELPLP